MNLAALKQNASYMKNISRQSDLTEKEKYAQRIEDQIASSGSIYSGGVENKSNLNVPLGKYVSQLEMKDPEARRRLREILELQMKEKESSLGNDPNRIKIRKNMKKGASKPPIVLHKTLNPTIPNVLPSLNVRSVSPAPLTNSLTPHRRNQGYVSNSHMQQII